MEFIKKYWISLSIGVLIGGFLIMMIQARIGMTGNQATIYAGFLGLVGGIVGAMSAFFIAKVQLDKQYRQQINLMNEQMNKQFENDKYRIRLELELEILQKTIVSIVDIQSSTLRIEKFIEDFTNQYFVLETVKQAIDDLRGEQYLGNDSCNKKLQSDISEWSKIKKEKERYFEQSFQDGKELIRKCQLQLRELLSLVMISDSDEVFYNKIMKVINGLVEIFQGQFTKDSIRELSEYNRDIEKLYELQSTELEIKNKKINEILNRS